MQSQSTNPQAAMPHDTLLASDLLRSFPAVAHQELLSILQEQHLPAGTTLFEQGAAGDSMYLIRSGQADVFVTVDAIEQFVTTYGPGSSVGEIALVTGSVRTARVVMQTEGTLLKLSRSNFIMLSERYPQAIASYTQLLLPRIRRSQVVGVVIGLFGQLAPNTLEDLLDALEWRNLPSGTHLFRQGDPGDSLAIVVTGRLQVLVVGEDNQQRVLSELGSGQAVGELALLTGEPRSATIQAIRDSDVVLLAKSAFDRLLTQYPQVMFQFTRIVIERLRRTSSQPVLSEARVGMNIVLVALDSNIDLMLFAGLFADVLATAGSTLWLNSTKLDTRFQRAGHANLPDQHPAIVTLNSWLTEREAEHRYLIYQTDPELTPWTLRCLRHADLILLLGTAGANPGISLVEHALEQHNIHARQELVLLHPGNRVATGETQRWLAPRQVQAHHHIRLASPTDLARLARLATGRGIGLVLGGGGARGFAHIGVLRAIEEAGIVPDTLGGTSAGALIAALAAHGHGWQALDALAKDLLQQWRTPDYTLPLVSLLRGHKLASTLQTLFGNTHIEDLWRPFFCPSVNLSQLQVHVHRQGPVWRAVRASTALPLIFPPLLEHGQILVDGGVIDNLPVATMRTQCPHGLVIGVDVAQEAALKRPYQFGASVSGWQVLLNRFRSAKTRIVAPSLIDTLLRVLEYSAVTTRHANAAIADILIRPPVTQYGTLEFSAYDTIVEHGYRAAQEQLEHKRTGEQTNKRTKFDQ